MNMSSNEIPIRVLCVFSTLDRGGAETMCMNLYRNLDRDEIQFDFVKHVHDEGTYEKEIKSLGGHIFEAPRVKIHNIISYENWWKRFLIAHPEYRIIHGHYFTISALYLRVAKKLTRSTVGHIQASSVDHKITELLIHQIGRYADKMLACSEMAGKWACGNEPFTVLKNAIAIDSFCYSSSVRSEYRKDLGIKDDEFVLGTVANLSTVKNPMGLIDIFLHLKQRNPKVKLLWIGEGSQRHNIEERLKSESLQSSVMLLGIRDDVPKLLQAMDAFALPSFNEGLGIAAIEAQAAGLETFCSTGVPREAAVTDMCHFLSLDHADAWADEICKIPVRDCHPDNATIIQKAGYDVKDTAKWIQEFYLSLSK